MTTSDDNQGLPPSGPDPGDAPPEDQSPVSAPELECLLHQANLDFWRSRPDEERAAYISQISQYFLPLLDDIYLAKEECEVRIKLLSRKNNEWKISLILGAGLIAMVNILTQQFGSNDCVGAYFPLTAAILAASLGVLHSLEAFFGYAQKAQSHIELRDMFLDIHREYNRLWVEHIFPFRSSPRACVNAGELYRRIVEEEKRLRAKYKEFCRAPQRNDSP